MPIKAKADEILYDDFSSKSFDLNKWNLRVDTEGQPLMEEYGIEEEHFHTAQKTPADRRVYIVPKHTFKAGESFEYDVNVISREGNYGNIVILNGRFDYARMGAVGYNNGPQTIDELGVSHVKIDFTPDYLILSELGPSGNFVSNQVFFQQRGEEYELYIGSFTGHNGTAHIDYDNFVLTTPSSAFIRGDANQDNEIDISDPLRILNHLYASYPTKCQDSLDINDDGKLDTTDAVYLLEYLFRNGNTIPEPFQSRGKDNTPDNLSCDLNLIP